MSVCDEPTGFVIQSNHSVFVDFGHVMNDVLWIDAARVQDLIQGHNSQNPLQAEKHETDSGKFKLKICLCHISHS